MPVDRGPASAGQLVIEGEQQRLIGWMLLVGPHRITPKDSIRVYTRR
jgi:hypothetical protein